MTDRETKLRAELRDLFNDDGWIYATEVVEWARSNEDSELHSRFQWNVEKAAYQHWLDQARRLIAVYVSTEDGERRTISLTPDRLNGGGYRDRDQVLASAEMRKQAVADALAEVIRWRDRNSHLNELAAIFAPIDAASGRPPPLRPTSRRRRPPAIEERPSA